MDSVYAREGEIGEGEAQRLLNSENHKEEKN